MEQTGSAVSHSSNKSEFLVSGKYRLVRKIGSGSFGDIYLGINVTNGEVYTRLIQPIKLRLIDFFFDYFRKSQSNLSQ